MEDKTLNSTNGRDLSELMTAGRDARPLWSVDELGAILEHQLNSSLLFDLGAFSREAEASLSGSRGAAGTPETFGQLLLHPRPPPELLVFVKDFGRGHRTDPASPLPKEIATVLYYGAIAAALTRRGTKISQLGDADLLAGLKWCASRPWMTAPIRELFLECVERLGASPTPKT